MVKFGNFIRKNAILRKETRSLWRKIMADDPMLSSYFWIKRILMHILWKNENFLYNEVDQTPSLTVLNKYW
jgi:hypothetical protein